MSEIDDLRVRLAHLEEQQGLEAAVAEAGQAYEAAPSQESLAAHDAAAVALAEHRARVRPEGGHRVGGDAFVVPSDNGREG